MSKIADRVIYIPEKVKRIERLESKIDHLKIIKNLLEELIIERDHSQDINKRMI